MMSKMMTAYFKQGQTVLGNKILAEKQDSCSAKEQRKNTSQWADAVATKSVHHWLYLDLETIRNQSQCKNHKAYIIEQKMHQM